MMQPYTPHGDSNGDNGYNLNEELTMQPYTPHGDSNPGSRTFMEISSDATLYPSRGQ